MQSKSLPERINWFVGILSVCLVVALLSIACKSTSQGGPDSKDGIVVINAPLSGRISRIVASEGTVVTSGATIVEISPESVGIAPNDSASQQDQARGTLQKSQADVAAARGETEHAAVELQRVRALVSAGNAPQSQLDAAQAEYQKAQQKLDSAESATRGAQGRLVYQEGQKNTGPQSAPSVDVTRVTAPSGGTVAVVTVRVGQHVNAGQPLATMRVSGE